MLEVKRFSAAWCGPCRALAPVMEGIKAEHSEVVFETIDVDVDHEQASKLKACIRKQNQRIQSIN
jgi:thiol-disulfide isomerase/thioredoxin